MAEPLVERLASHVATLIDRIVERAKALPPGDVKPRLRAGFVTKAIRSYLREHPEVLEDLAPPVDVTERPLSLLDDVRPRISARQFADVFAQVAGLGVEGGLGEAPDVDDPIPYDKVRDILNGVPALAQFQKENETPQDRAKRFVDEETVGGLRVAGTTRPRDYSNADRALTSLFQRFLADGSSCGNHMFAGKAYQILLDRVVCVQELPFSLTSTTEDDVYWRSVAEARFQGGISHVTLVVGDVHTFDSKEFSILLPDERQEPRKPDLDSYAGAEPGEITRNQARLASSTGSGSDIWLPLVTPPFGQFPMGSELISVDITFQLIKGTKTTLTDFLETLAEALGIVVNVGTVIAGLVTLNPAIPAAGTVATAVAQGLVKFLKLISGETRLVEFKAIYSAKALQDAFDAQTVMGSGGYPGTRFTSPFVSGAEAVTDLTPPYNTYGVQSHQRFIGSSVDGRQRLGDTSPPAVSSAGPTDISYWYEVILRFERKPAPVVSTYQTVQGQ